MTCGEIKENGEMTCPHCDGQGYRLLVDDDNPEGPIKNFCNICYGKGKTNWVDLIVPPNKTTGISGLSGVSGYGGCSGYGGYGGRTITITDSAGKELTGWIKEAGALEYDINTTKLYVSTGNDWSEIE